MILFIFIDIMTKEDVKLEMQQHHAERNRGMNKI